MSIIIICFVILNSHTTPSFSRPFSSLEVRSAGEGLVYGYVEDPDGRGTSDIVISCLATMALCVWSSLHLNLPLKSETRFQAFLRYVKWILLGIFIPELVVLSAWKQWLSAKRMTSQMKKILDEGDDLQQQEGPRVENAKRYTTDKAVAAATGKTEWTFSHSMYAGMGGFAFEMDLLPQGDQGFIPNRDRLTLTAAGVLLLARCGRLPVISAQDLNDKSKRDAIERVIVCLQAGWMLVQTISRAAARQTITLLEFNTLGHVFTAFIIYLLWWRKPSDVQHPTFVQGDGMEALCAYTYMSSRISGRKALRRIKLQSWRKPELAAFAWFANKPATPPATPPAAETRPPRSPQLMLSPSLLAPGWSWFEDPRSPGTPSRSERRSIMDEVMGRLRGRPEPATPQDVPDTVVKRIATFETMPAVDDTSAKLRMRTELVSEAIRTYPAIAERFVPRTTTDDSGETIEWSEPVLEQLVLTSIGDWPSDHYLPGINDKVLGMAMWFASMGYGAVHAAAWRDFFPTDIERSLWRFSSVYITCSGALWVLLCSVCFKYGWASRYWDRFKYLQLTWAEYIVIIGTMFICGMAYIFARMFLVVDGLVSLRVLPKDAYEVPPWMSSIPHI